MDDVEREERAERRRARRAQNRWYGISLLAFPVAAWGVAELGRPEWATHATTIAVVAGVVSTAYFMLRTIQDSVEDLHFEMRTLRDRVDSATTGAARR